jgi:hypothetical protein
MKKGRTKKGVGLVVKNFKVVNRRKWPIVQKIDKTQKELFVPGCKLIGSSFQKKVGFKRWRI